ncbi:winged helix-turn-helix transcriptional regulator [candidate division KSB1 bacterium]
MITRDLSFLQPTMLLRELMILLELRYDSEKTQKQLAESAEIVPAMVNTYLKEFCSQDFIRKVGNNRNMSYHLTEPGSDRISGLEKEYMREIILLFKGVKLELESRLRRIFDSGVRRVAFYGAAETGQVTVTVAEEIGFEVVGVVDSDPEKQRGRLAGRPIQTPSSLESYSRLDGIIITSFGYQDEIFESVTHLESKGIRIYKL